ncbi:hypothetical protein KI387_025485, partial [Taxus chinensis]
IQKSEEHWKLEVTGFSQHSDLNTKCRESPKFRHQKWVSGFLLFPPLKASVGFRQDSDISDLSGSQSFRISSSACRVLLFF